MASNLFLLLCLTGASAYSEYRLRSVPHNYYLIKKNLDWFDAQSYCRENYVDLATVVSDHDWTELNREIAIKGLTVAAWVGLYARWSWSYNSIPIINMTWRNWGWNEPDITGGTAECGTMGPLGFWNDFPCSDLNPFVCFNANLFGAGRFIGFASPQLTWPDAQTYCRTYYTDLATVASFGNNLAINEFTVFHGQTWIGLFRDIWKWSDWTIASTIRWSPASPNNINGKETCGALAGSGFDDRECIETYYFFCHTIPPIREKQIMQIKVTSNEMLNDPDYQSEILELVRQKLKEHGMLEDTVVTWRRSGGQIFEKEPNMNP